MKFLDPVSVGRLTLAPEVHRNLAVHDITLREGEEAAEVNFSLEQKLSICDGLIDAGVKYVQGGLPWRSKIDAQFIREVKASARRVEVEALVQIFTRDWKEQIDAAVRSRADRVSLMYPASDVRLKHVQKVSRDDALARIREAVAYACSRGVKVRFSPTDGTRAELAFLLQAFEAALSCGADVISVTDTVGCMTPHGMAYLVTAATRTIGATVQVHCHNDYGLALANAIAAVGAGAAAVDTSINGLGERSGNVVMAEFVTTMQYLYGVDLGIDLCKLTELSRLVSEMSGVPLSATQPLTGPNSFAHKIDAHIYGLDRIAEAYEFIEPATVGNARRIPLGKYSGPYVVKKKLVEAGIDIDEKDVPLIVNEVHERATRVRRALTDTELVTIAREISR